MKVNAFGVRESPKTPYTRFSYALKMMDEMLKAMNPLIMYDLEKHHPKAYKKFRNYKYDFMYAMIIENLRRGLRRNCTGQR